MTQVTQVTPLAKVSHCHYSLSFDRLQLADSLREVK